MELLFSFESEVPPPPAAAATYSIIVAVAAVVFMALLYTGYLKSSNTHSGYLKSSSTQSGKTLPPGSFGFPIIGESISFGRAYKDGKLGEWTQARTDKHGSVFKTSLFGRRTIFVTGQAGNKFLFSGNSSNGIIVKQPPHVRKILGENSIFDLSGPKHEILRSLVRSILVPDHLKTYVSQIDSIVRQQILQDMNGKESIKMVPLMKKISFNVACGLLFGLAEGEEKDALHTDFSVFVKGISAFPMNIPGTAFYNALQARHRLCKRLSLVLTRTAKELENRELGHNENLVSRLLSLRDENGDHLTEEAIQDNLLTMFVASYDTVASVLSTFVRKLARDSEVYDKILEEQKEVVNASRDGNLTWDEIRLMKYTWQVAQELMRLTPPASGNFKFAEKDTTFSGFDIPKGWHVFWVASPTHMSEDIFDEPETFNPARFRSDSLTSIPPYTYIPFGAGNRICPGAEFARVEILVIIHHLVTNYSWTEMISDEPITSIPMPFPAMGLPVRINHKQG